MDEAPGSLLERPRRCQGHVIRLSFPDGEALQTCALYKSSGLGCSAASAENRETGQGIVLSAGPLR